jgi:hypothetical protein
VHRNYKGELKYPKEVGCFNLLETIAYGNNGFQNFNIILPKPKYDQNMSNSNIMIDLENSNQH